MNDNHIETKIHYPLLLDGNETVISKNKLINSIDFKKKVLSIPMNPWLEEKELFSITSIINDFYDR